ncbi:MAG: response regulator [Desulfotignum sp.]
MPCIRDSVYLWYVAASCASFAYSAMLTNISAYVISDFGMPPKYGFLAGCFTFVAQLILFQRLLETKATFPKIDRVMTGAVIAGTGLIAISPWLSYQEFVRPIMLLSTVSYIGILVVASLRARAGYRPALYFLLGWVPFIASLFITMSEYAGFIAPTSWVSYLIPVGLSWEMAIFSLALASRIKILRDERDTLQAQQIKVSENARRTLARSNQIKDDFLNAVSHELRTPLHTIQGQLDLLREAPLNSEQSQAYRLIEYANLRMTRQVGGILDFVDAQDDSLLSSPQVFVPASLFELLEYEFFEPIRAKPVSLAFSLEENVPGRIYMDGLMLEKVLYQLIDNAIKFTPAGGHIFVKAEKAGSENTLVLRISDTGPGIPDNQRAKVFRAFSQGESGLTRRYGVVRLGLPLANALSHALGGTISILPSDEDGTTVEVTIPYGEFHESGHITPEANIDQELHRIPRVLVVEDDAANRMIIRKQLEKMGVLSEGVQNGLEAVEAAMKEPWDLIIMDCQMPVMDGIEATRKIRLESARNMDTPVIALTANASESYRQKCLRAGMDEYCTKPLRMNSLRKLVGKYAHSRNKERYKAQQGLNA